MTFTAGQKVRASQLNLLDLLANAQDDFDTASQDITSTSFATPPTSASVTVTSAGTTALVIARALMDAATAGTIFRGSVSITGDTTITAAANVTNGFFLENTYNNPIMVTAAKLITINPGTNVYTLQYFTSSGTAVLGGQNLTVIAP
jgi:hypothetical protein